MNDKQILELEKQLIPDLPQDFWQIKEESEQIYDFWDRLLYFCVVIGGAFQLVCLIALVCLKAHPEERNFSADSHHINNLNKEDNKTKKEKKLDKKRK